MATWTMQDRVCCSCRYWSGDRNIDFMAIFVESKSKIGRCNGPIGSNTYMDMNESNTCGYWEKVR